VKLPRLIVITDWSLPGATLLAKLKAVCEVSPEIAIQHRHPGATVRQFYQEAKSVAEICRLGGNTLFINGHLDVAVLLGASAHLPGGNILAKDARVYLPRALISVSVHDLEEARQAERADIALVSPVFVPGSKLTDPRTPLGPNGFQRLARAVPCTSFALGGITPTNAASVPADGYAVVQAVLGATDPQRAARELLSFPKKAD
jgi:thiamine-phosphate pyrophosphorylase